MLKNSPLAQEVSGISEVKSNQKEYHLSSDELTAKKRKAIHDFLKLKKDLTKNGYQSGFVFIEEIRSFPWSVLPFSMAVLLSFLIFLYSLMEKPKVIFVLAVATLTALLIQLIILFFGKILEDIEQIKIGYYLLLLNILLIAVVANKQSKKETSASSH